MKKWSVFCLLLCLSLVSDVFAADAGQNALDQVGSGQDRLVHWELYQQARGRLTTPVAQ